MKGFIVTTQDNDSIESEIWKDIHGYEGMYQVSNFGRVKSLKRYRVPTDRILRPVNNGRGYLLVNLCRDKKAKTIHIHKLVMLTFVGKCPKGLQINHKDGDKANNYLSNLEYCTPFQNMQHALETGLIDTSGEDNGRAKLTETQVLEIRARYSAGGVFQRELAKEYGVSQDTISLIIKRKTWKHI